MNTRPAFERALITDLFESSFPQLLCFAVQNLTFRMDVLEAFVVRQACDLLQGLIAARDDRDLGRSGGCDHYRRLYAFALMWSVGALLEHEDRVKMEEFLRNHDAIQLDLPPQSSSTESTMFDYMVESNGKISSVTVFVCNTNSKYTVQSM